MSSCIVLFQSTPTRVAWLYGSVLLAQVMDPPCTTPRPSGMFISSRCVSFHSSRDLGLRNPSCLAPDSLENTPAPSDVFSGGTHRLRSTGSWDVLSILSSPLGFKLRPYDLQDDGPVSSFRFGVPSLPLAHPDSSLAQEDPDLGRPIPLSTLCPDDREDRTVHGVVSSRTERGARGDVGSLHESYRTR